LVPAAPDNESKQQSRYKFSSIALVVFLWDSAYHVMGEFDYGSKKLFQ